jgi:hypothetical protein
MVTEQDITRVHCNKCQEYINLKSPFYIRKKKGKYGDLISIRGLCSTCQTAQSRKLPENHIRSEARDTFKSYPYGDYKLDNEGNILNKDGGFLPFLLPLIFGGIAAAASA